MRWGHLWDQIIGWLASHGLEAHELDGLQMASIRSAAGVGDTVEVEVSLPTPITIVCQRGLTPIIYEPLDLLH